MPKLPRAVGWPRGRWQVTVGGYGSVVSTLARAKTFARDYSWSDGGNQDSRYTYACITRIGHARAYKGRWRGGITKGDYVWSPL